MQSRLAESSQGSRRHQPRGAPDRMTQSGAATRRSGPAVRPPEAATGRPVQWSAPLIIQAIDGRCALQGGRRLAHGLRALERHRGQPGYQLVELVVHDAPSIAAIGRTVRIPFLSVHVGYYTISRPLTEQLRRTLLYIFARRSRTTALAHNGARAVCWRVPWRFGFGTGAARSRAPARGRCQRARADLRGPPERVAASPPAQCARSTATISTRFSVPLKSSGLRV